MNAPPSFRPRWPWVTADLQTIRNVLPGRLAGIPAESGQRFEIPLRDGSGDRLVARFHPGRKPVPAMVLVPGLTGCEASRYVLQSAGAWLASGAPVVRLNLRGSPPGRSVAHGHYHMDRVRDLADACLAVADLDPGIRDRGIAIVGFSLGGGGGPDCPPPEPPLRAVVARAPAARDGAGLARFTGLGARGPCARTPCPGLRRRVHRNGRGVSRCGGLLRLMLADPRHRCASHPRSPPARKRRSLGFPAVHHRTSSAPRHRHARRRSCRISRERKPTSLVRVYRRRVRSGVHERAMSPAYAVTIGRGGHGFRLRSRHVRMLHPASFLGRDSCVPEPDRPGNQSAGPLQQRAQPRSGRGACGG